jgi:chitinase
MTIQATTNHTNNIRRTHPAAVRAALRSLESSTTAPYTFTWGSVAAGTYSITAKATDNLAATATSTAVSVTSVTDTGPTVSLTSPTAGSVAAPATFTLTATASSSVSTIKNVAFYSGTTLLATVTSSPYTYSWSNVAAGTYSLTAKATDALGKVTTSTAVSVKSVTDAGCWR